MYTLKELYSRMSRLVCTGREDKGPGARTTGGVLVSTEGPTSRRKVGVRGFPVTGSTTGKTTVVFLVPVKVYQGVSY